jgi:hypothetical protein
MLKLTVFFFFICLIILSSAKTIVLVSSEDVDIGTRKYNSEEPSLMQNSYHTIFKKYFNGEAKARADLVNILF